ncbi:MAG: DegT/DnrJ/EryC1/StrS family aminotransferase [Nitrospirota bacterium]
MTIDKTHVPFVDLITPHVELERELTAVFQQAVRSAGFIGGPMVSEFEKRFAEFSGTSQCVGVSSGTDALRFALMAAGVQKGDRVITVPNTFIATTEAITQAGAVPDFVDIDERTYNMDPEKLREYIEIRCAVDKKTGRIVNRATGQPVSAVVPVHLYGQPADMDPILELAERYGLIVVEDACQAHGAEYLSKAAGGWRKAGSIGKAAAFSFYPGKNLGACGEAGAVTTNDEGIASKIRMLRDHGQVKKYVHDVEGYNGRLDAIQAGILSVKLKRLPEWNEERRRLAARYNELLGDVDDLVRPVEPEWAKSVYHLYVVRVPDRDDVQKHLSENDIATGLHYPVPLHLQKAYADLGYKNGDFPVTEKVSKEILSLPMYPGLAESQQQRVAECLQKQRS